MYSEKSAEKDESVRCTTLVMDNNPALPQVGSIIHRHKHLLEKDENLKNVIKPSSVFVSYRKNKTIGDMLIHNRYRSSFSSTEPLVLETPPEPNTAVVEPQDLVTTPGCMACGKCYVCKVGYLTPCDSFTSYHTTQIFKISKQLSCQSIGLIYLAECITCESSCVGYSIGNLPKRFSNHQSHIKRGVKSCRLTNNFLEKDHELVREKSQKDFDASLVKHIRIKIIDNVNFDSNLSTKEKENLCKERERERGILAASLKNF